MEPILRFSARVVPVNDAGEVLLLQDQDPARPGKLRWGTVGGAVDPGETHVDAALRELHEETGLTVQPEELTGPFHQDRHEFSWGGQDYLGDSTFFAMRLDAGATISFDHLEPAEVGNVIQARWWMPEDEALAGALVTSDLSTVLKKAVRSVRAERGGTA